MLAILQFIFSSFWVWLGTLILILTVLTTLGQIVDAINKD